MTRRREDGKTSVFITGAAIVAHCRVRLTAMLGGAALVAAGVVPVTMAAQSATPPAPVQQPPAADTADVASLDAIIKSLYDVISGPAGAPRNWNRFRSLFAPGARLIPTGAPAGQRAIARMMSPEDYAATSGPLLERNGFFEREIARTTDAFGRITHVFSTYESRRTAADPQPFARGINSIQLLNDGARWWIVTVYWDAERPDNPIPAKYDRRRDDEKTR